MLGALRRIVAFALAFGTAACAAKPSPLPVTLPSTSSVVPALNPHIAAEIQLGPPEGRRLGVSLGAGYGAAWIGVQDETATEGVVARVDPVTNEIAKEIPVPGSPSSLAAGEGAIWAIVSRPSEEATLVKIDPAIDEVVATIPIHDDPWNGADALAVGEGGVWVAVGGEGAFGLLRVDPQTNEIVDAIPLPRGPVSDIEVGDGAIWLSAAGEDHGIDLFRVDPTRDEVAATIRVGARPGTIAVGAGFVWASLAVGVEPTAYWDTTAGAQRIDVETNELVGPAIPLKGGSPDPLDGPSAPFAVGDGGVWVGGSDHSQRLFVVARLNLDTMRIDHAIGVPAFVMGMPILDVTNDAVWVSHNFSVFRIDLR